jgi:hypothetical protein
LAAVGASVRVDIVGVVTGFARINSVVSAVFKAAFGVAVIAVVVVAIVARFAAIDAPVSATFYSANAVAAVAGLKVAIITGFQVLTQHGIAAKGDSATVEAGIDVDPVSIVTGFIALFTFGQIEA